MPITSQEIQNQLELILNASNFNASDRLKKFFRFIVEETLTGNAGQLKAYTIATTVFGRGANFDPLHDPVVRIETAKLRNRLMEYYFSTPDPGPVRIDVPKGGYVPIFNRIGKVLENSPPGEQPASGPKAQAATQIAIAVLPFTNLSENPDDLHFIEGLADETTLALTRFEDLSVVSSYAARCINPSTEPLYVIAQKLSVRFILHGSAQLHNNHIRLRAELADAATGTNIWAERFDAKIGGRNLFAVQEEMAQRLVSRVGDSFGSIRRKLMQELSCREYEHLEFYETMLSYHNWMPTFNRELFLHAKQSLEQLILISPNNPMVVATLADLYASDYQLGYDTVPNALDKAQEFALRAIALDGTSQTAYWALALNFFLRRNLPQFEKAIAQVIPLNPANSYMILATGLLTGLSGNFDEGIALMERCRELNPCSPSWGRIVPYLKYYLAGNFELASNEALLVNTPGCFWDPMLRAAAFGRLGKTEEAKEAVNELLNIQPDFTQNPLRYVHTLALSDEAAALILQGLNKAGLSIAAAEKKQF